MSDKPTYKELEQRIQLFEQANLKLKRRAKDLQEVEERHRSIWEHTSDAIFCYEYDPPIPTTLPVEEQVHRLHYGKLVVCNDVAACYFGHKHPEDVMGMKVNELFSSGPGGPVDRMFNAFVQNGYRIFEVESIEVLPDGSERQFLNNAQGIVVDGHLIRVCGAYHDITKQKQTEEALRDNEAKMRSIFLSAPVGIGVVVNRVFQDVNSRFCEITGYDKDELVGKSARIIYLSDEGYEYVGKEKYRQIGQLGTGVVETRLKRKDNRVIDVLMSSTPLDPGDLSAGVTFTVLDITERKSAEEALRQSEKRFRELSEMLPETVFESDKDLNLTFVNQQAYEMFGYSKEDFKKGVNGYDMLVPEDRIRARDNVIKRFQGAEFGVNEYRGLRKDGSTFPILFHTSPIINNETVLGLRGIVVDITERIRIEDQLRQAQKMESVGRLAGGVAHDFNNMLGVILGHVNMATEKKGSGQPLDHHLEEIRKATDRSANLTRQLLAFARKQTVLPKVLDLNETVSGMLNLLQRLIGEDIQLTWNPSLDLWPVRVDPTQIDQILANLCVNARDAVEDVGNISIGTGNTRLDKAFCSQRPGSVPGNYVKIVVSDDGCGMDKATLSQIFEPFFTTKEVGRGTGLGLSTVYGIVKQNNGFVDVQSNPDSGTTFTIYLPRHEGKMERVLTKSAGKTDARGQGTILLVEDEPSTLEMVKLMLESLGYHVLPTSAPSEAIRLAKKHGSEIQLLITDVIMPEMNGQELSQSILSFHPDFKCLFMSGYSADIIAHRGVLDSSVNFIQKPFALKDFAGKVRKLLDSE